MEGTPLIYYVFTITEILLQKFTHSLRVWLAAATATAILPNSQYRTKLTLFIVWSFTGYVFNRGGYIHICCFCNCCFCTITKNKNHKKGFWAAYSCYGALVSTKFSFQAVAAAWDSFLPVFTSKQHSNVWSVSVYLFLGLRSFEIMLTFWMYR